LLPDLPSLFSSGEEVIVLDVGMFPSEDNISLNWKLRLLPGTLVSS
jgi:hypothetical protein